MEMKKLLLMVCACAATASMAGADPALKEMPPNRWVAMNEPAAGVQMLGWDEARYVPELRGVVFSGAYRSFTSENQNALWLYRFGENRWRLLHLNLFNVRSELAADGGHTAGRMGYDPLRRVMVYGGLVSMSRNDRFRTWVFDPAALVGWDARPPAPAPALSFDAATVFVPALTGLFTYEVGRGAWAYDAGGNRWRQLAKAGTGPAGSCAEAVYDPKRKRVLVFGGSRGHYSGKDFTVASDLWAFDPVAKAWQKLEAKNPPPGRGWPQMALSGAADVVLMCDGSNGKRIRGSVQKHADTWVLDLKTLAWTELKDAGPSPSPGWSNHVAYDPAADVFLAVGSRKLPYGYSCGMYAMKYKGAAATRPAPPKIEPAPAYDLDSLPKPIGKWEPLGDGAVSAVGGWAFRPALAARGDELLLAFGEYDPPGKYRDEGCHVYAFRYAGGKWTRLGGNRVSDKGDHSKTPAVAFDAGGSPVVAYNYIRPWKGTYVAVKRFAGGSWRQIGERPDWSYLPALAAGPKALAVGWQYNPAKSHGFAPAVATLTGDSWRQIGDADSLCVRDGRQTRERFLSLATDPKGGLIAAWQEHRPDARGKAATPERIRVRRFGDGKWTKLADAVPVGSDAARSVSYAMGIHGRSPVVAACEGADAGRAKLIVRIWRDGKWTQLGDGALNVLGPAGGALKPALASDGKTLQVAWPEFLPGRRPLLFVKQWDGSRWKLIGGPLNAAPGKGSAHRPAMAILGGKPVVAWTEYDPDSDRLRRLHIRRMK